MGMFYVMSIIVPLKINVESPKEREKKELQSNLSEKRKVKTSDEENWRVHFYIDLLEQEE